MIKRRIALLVTLLIALGGCFFVYTFYRVFFFQNTAFTNDYAYVFIPSKATFEELRTELSPLLLSFDDFALAAEKKGYATRIRGGKYRLKKGANNNEIINTLRSGSLPVRVTFNNMERLENLAGRVAQQIEADSLSLLTQMRSSAFIQAHDFTPANALAMYIPNTYSFYWNTSPEEFQQRMWKEYQRFWGTERRAKAEALGLSPQEVICLAAIVQKETQQNSEKPVVAGVYLNRLKKRMRLQADPTVVFALKQQKNDFDLIIRRVLKKDLKIDSPYNTYKYRGLPPGPISMPDVSSIDAVLQATEHNYLYFVADPQQPGFHQFSKTLREHNRKARSYYRYLNQRKLYR